MRRQCLVKMGSGRMGWGGCFAVLSLLTAACVGQAADPIRLAYEAVAIDIESPLEAAIPYAVSADGDLIAVSVKYKSRSGGGKGFIYREVGERDWEIVLTVEHPGKYFDFGDSIHLDKGNGWLFVGLAHHIRIPSEDMPSDCGGEAENCGEIIFYRFNKDSYELEGDGQLIEGNTGEHKLFGYHVDSFGDSFLVTHKRGFHVYRVGDDGVATSVQDFFLDNMYLPDAFEQDVTDIRVEKCEMDEKYYACGVGVVVPLEAGDKYPPDVTADPWLIVISRDSSETFAVLEYRTMFPEGDHFFQMPRVHVGLDKGNSRFIAGFPSRKQEFWNDENGVEKSKDLDPGRAVIVNITESESGGIGLTWSEIMIDFEEDEPEFQSYDGFGHSVSCDNEVCVSCSDHDNPRCYLLQKNPEDGEFLVVSRLRKNMKEDEVVGNLWGDEVIIRDGRAVVSESLIINIYENLEESNFDTSEIENSGGWCFGAEAQVEVQKAGSNIVEILPLERVSAGDLVASIDNRGNKVFSEVFLTQHDNDNRYRPVLRITYVSDSDKHEIITVTRNHLLSIPSGDSSWQTYVAAQEVQIGSTIYIMSDGGVRSTAVVVAISESSARIRNVHTMNDRIIVESVVASCFAELPSLVAIGGSKLAAIESVLIFPLKLMHRLGLQGLVKHVNLVMGRVAESLSP